MALSLQAGGARRRERAWLLLQTGDIDRPRLRALLDAHGIKSRFPMRSDPIAEGIALLLARKQEWHRQQARQALREKVRILLELQRPELPLLARQRPLRAWERPWDVTP